MKNLLQRIAFDQRRLHGKPVIRGMRISVEMVLELEDIQAALSFA